MDERVSGVVLAGGRATRLGGKNKALLEVGGRPVIRRVLDTLGAFSTDLVLVVNDDSLTGLAAVRLVYDPEPHAGVLPALLRGLETVQGDLAVVVACDMPFLNLELIGCLLQRAAGTDVAIPVLGGRHEPMHAVYRSQPCAQAIRATLAEGGRRMISFLDRLHVQEVREEEIRALDPDLHSFLNVNTPQDLERARRFADAPRH